MAPLSDDDAATLSTKLDGAIGEWSMFHQTHGYYVQGVGRDTAVLPEGWENRLVAVSGPNTNGRTGLCLDARPLPGQTRRAPREGPHLRRRTHRSRPHRSRRACRTSGKHAHCRPPQPGEPSAVPQTFAHGLTENSATRRTCHTDDLRVARSQGSLATVERLRAARNPSICSAVPGAAHTGPPPIRLRMYRGGRRGLFTGHVEIRTSPDRRDNGDQEQILVAMATLRCS
jgi:hypothetical protein